MTIHDVLFATDFSEASRLAGRTAGELARPNGARLHLLDVGPPVTDPAPAPAALRAAPAQLLMGSVAEAVVRRAGCRVLTVPAGATAAPRSPVVADEVVETMSCAVCGGPSQDDLICEACRARIRGEALERKRGEERPGRR